MVVHVKKVTLSCVGSGVSTAHLRLVVTERVIDHVISNRLHASPRRVLLYRVQERAQCEFLGEVGAATGNDHTIGVPVQGDM